ncbi:Ascochitine biosynthesis cluster transcriptional regulator [Pseudocercospora fuligena]|uniref:Ascochitine biosynthesis cluster transcriptional regulator n=1 Tax=Pseudocercospora fuligena TaxID=685502 RepID=A0A8H6RK87_9PEZI|nr:Ascochitine biosynthesis cluster transcriptional regulator [Pseudocercospora fuligena]
MNCLSLENLQALIIIAFDDIGSGFTAKAWPIIASLTRSVEYAQLTQEFEPGNHRPLCQPHLLLPCTDDWTDSEERRRVFWNVFLLDRLCSVSTGWNTSLTSDDVHRRLPCDGHLWRKQEAVLTPYFGIWDKSSGCDGAEVDPITGQGNGFMTDGFMHMQPSILPASMSTVGAFAYNIEATESMSRVMSYFLQQKVDFSSMESVSAWLTRFKELDHRLALWKMLLPQRWRTNPNLTRLVPLMDPNLTTAHVTHNASTILLHQVIAYPPKHWRFCERLPSGYSAETCYSAGVEIATITTKYLSRSPSGSPIGSQYGFCLFIAANVLLIHWRYTDGDQLAPEYWSIIQSLEVMATRWSGLPAKSTGSPSLFMKYANRLRALYDPCTSHSTFQPEIMSFTYEIDPPRDPSNSAQPALTCWSMPTDAHNMPLHNAEASISLASSGNASEYVLDQDFLDLDRIISFDDGILFAAAFEPGSEIW